MQHTRTHPKVRIQKLGPGVARQQINAGDLSPLVKVHHSRAELAEVLVDEIQTIRALKI